MSFKKVLGTLSPAYGMATGEGMFGNAVGVLPAIAKDMRDDREEKKRRAAEAGMVPGQGGQAPMPMKKGGKVSSASKRADGCAIKGKTKGRMV
jgi:hypothetical protein